MGSGNAPLRAMIANTVSVRRRAGKKADIHAFRSIGQQGLTAAIGDSAARPPALGVKTPRTAQSCRWQQQASLHCSFTIPAIRCR
jgi:hypothetical protein